MKRDLISFFCFYDSNAKFEFQSIIFYKDEQMKIAQIQGCQEKFNSLKLTPN